MSYLLPTDNAKNYAPDGTAMNNTFEITIRFSASIPDLPLSVPASSNNGPPTTASLKQLIRASIPADLSDKRIRLIHAGKALDDPTLLSVSLKRHVSRPPSRMATPGPYDTDDTDTDRDRPSSKAKGKLPIRDPPLARIYIHCSIGDVTLSAEDLEAEAKLASQSFTFQDEQENKTVVLTDVSRNVTTTIPAPRGFDRLLTAGFTPSEIASLRLQFMSIQAHTHTPDTMPSPNTLRALEDHWLDNSDSTQSGSLAGLDDALATGAATGTTNEDSGGLDDMIWGTVAGFFWPIACLIWGLREEGIFTPRRKIAIVVGGMLNLGLGFVRWGG